ncbi:MAG: putative penicillin acylase [Frankiales bacterium]|nr:putative penicillin acylase [Frankiales bacterium]
MSTTRPCCTTDTGRKLTCDGEHSRVSHLSRVVVASVAALVLAAGSAQAVTTAPSRPASGLPAVTSGHRPGPDVLYAAAPRAPQLENTGPWRAAPILTSGATSYRDGEWLYQDYLFDDHGATGAPDPNSPYGASTHLYSPAGGSYTYPTDKRYANNAADLVELRVKPLADATAFRLTLNTLIDPARTGATIALGDGPSTGWPFGAGVSSPSKLFVTWHGGTAVVTGSVTGMASARVDTLRRQVEIRVPHSVWNPGTTKVRTTVGVGLWDVSAGRYLAPAPGAATATTPGGGPGTAIVNVGPRTAEPQPFIVGATMADTAAGAAATTAFWRDRSQSMQLTRGDVTPFASEVDFGKLRRRVHDDSGVPVTGPIDRLFASHYSYGQGVDATRVCFDLASSFAAGAACKGSLVGQLQPYSLYVPAKKPAARGYGMTLLLHSLSANYNQYAATHNQSQLGDRGTGSLVLTPAGRGPDGFYAGTPEADTFEAWADVARHYRLDPSWTTVSGYSMGGFGTFRMLARWPDLFSRGFSVVGAPGSVADQLASLRNTPLLSWNSTEDELVNISTTRATVDSLTAAGVRFEEHLHLTADHLTLAANDQYAPGAAWLGQDTVDRNPFHVTFVVDPSEDAKAATVVADHAYWLSGLRGHGTVDAVSTGFGHGDAVLNPVADGAGVLTGGEIPALAYAAELRTWGPLRSLPKSNSLLLKANGITAVTIDAARARLTCDAVFWVRTNVPMKVTFCGKTRTYR